MRMTDLVHAALTWCKLHYNKNNWEWGNNTDKMFLISSKWMDEMNESLPGAFTDDTKTYDATNTPPEQFSIFNIPSKLVVDMPLDQVIVMVGNRSYSFDWSSVD